MRKNFFGNQLKGRIRGQGALYSGYGIEGCLLNERTQESLQKMNVETISMAAGIISCILTIRKKEETMTTKHYLKGYFIAFVAVMTAQFALPGLLAAVEPSKIVQAQAVLTVSESKRLIAKAVKEMPIVKNALANGMVIIVKGTTNAYVAEEITGNKIEKAAFVRGRIQPAKGGKRLPDMQSVPDVILVKGKVVDMPLAEAVKKLQPGDVVMKGANALDYKNKLAGVNIGDPSAGTTGITLPYVVARKAYLVIPVGLEKLVAGDLVDLTLKMREPIETLNGLQSMFLLTGQIVTELEAINVLTGATAFQCSAGGIGGAEGSVWLVFRGTREQVNNALKLVHSIQGEPPYVE